MLQHLLLASGGEILRVVDSADFDGTGNLMERGAALSGIADSKKGVFSGWVRLDGGDAAQMYILVAVGSLNGNIFNGLRIRRETTNLITVLARAFAGTTLLSLSTVGTYVAGSTWLHILSSWDVATAGARHLYINDTSDLSVVTFTDGTINYSDPDWGIGGTPAGGSLLNGCLAEIYFAPGQYLDFSVAANRRKFISASGKPVHLGTDGTLPGLGTPKIYLHLDDGEAVANFATNRGDGGNFTITGTLATGSTSPSD